MSVLVLHGELGLVCIAGFVRLVVLEVRIGLLAALVVGSALSGLHSKGLD